MPIRSLSRFVLPLGLALVVPALGCGAGVANAQAASAEPTSRAPVAPNAHGPLKIVGEALSDVPLTSAQRTRIDQLAAEADARHDDARGARKDLALALAAQVQAGHVDRAALQPQIDALAAALRKVQPADRVAIEQLHAVLVADQRVAFVDALEAHIGEHKEEWAEKHPLKQWATDLKLSEDQIAQIRTAMKGQFDPHGHGKDGGMGHHEHGDHPSRGAKILAAFKQDRFVMDEVLPPRDVSKDVARMSDRFLRLVEAVLPVLTPDQRTLAAQKMRERADSMGDMGPSGPMVE
jgi:Spy/CpxP family protein refolding chaperone